ncbi:MAG: PAS domain-containing sensor histidine kinase [Betaproteobacteria bacterium]|nr:MAG: PAS domain-containing sensor histidine kinase [Betaproteobacteria bacterium]
MTGRYAGLELLATAVLALDERMGVQYANPAAENLLAIASRNLLGQHFPSLFAEGAELERALGDALQARWDSAAQSVNYERPGEEPLPLACIAARTEVPGVPLVVELRPIGEQLRIEREERLMDQQAASRELIRNLAHEIRNPLGGLRGSAQLLERELERPELREYTQVIIGEADRLQALMDRLLTPHRAPQPARLNIHEVLERVRNLVIAEFSQGIAILCNYDPSVPDLVGDREQLIQALLNVARNAAQALAPGAEPPSRRGTIILRTRVARQITIARQRHKLALELQVIDDGPGVPGEIRDRIFNPLVSGREGGSGLGLSLAQTYVHYHGGVIECDSRPGRTVFRILLPLT